MFLYPPHPSKNSRIRREQLPIFEKREQHVAQRKFGGTHVVISINKKKIDIWDRRGKQLSTYHLTESMKECLLSLDIKSSRQYVLAGELLHTKAKSKITGTQAATNTIVLFDVLFAERYVFPQMERLDLLFQLCHSPVELESKGRALSVVTNNGSQLWLAEVFKDEFLYHFDEFFDFHCKTGVDKFPEIEGLILRKKDSILTTGLYPYDVDWLIRVRKEKPNSYEF